MLDGLVDLLRRVERFPVLAGTRPPENASNDPIPPFDARHAERLLTRSCGQSPAMPTDAVRFDHKASTGFTARLLDDNAGTGRVQGSSPAESFAGSAGLAPLFLLAEPAFFCFGFASSWTFANVIVSVSSS